MQSWFFRCETGSINTEALVLLSGLATLTMSVISSLSGQIHDASETLTASLSIPLKNSGFNTAHCPNNWAQSHGDTTGLGTLSMQALLRDKDRIWSNETLQAVLNDFSSSPHDFRNQDPMVLAEVQIALCLSESRNLPIPSAFSI